MKRLSRMFGPGLLPALAVILTVPFGARAESPRVIVGIDALRAEIAGLPSGQRDVLLFSPDDHLADLFLPLHREEKVAALAVVVPSEKPLADENLSTWKDYVSSLSPGAGKNFVMMDNSFEGTLQGLPVRVGSIRGWKGDPGAGPAILDLAFLVAMYEDEVRTPFVDLPRKFLATLEDRKLERSRLTLWMKDRAAIPLANGYLPRLAGEVVANPAAFRERLPAKWEEVRQGEYFAFFGAYEEAVPHFERYLRDEPEDPAVLFRLAQISFVDREVERGIRFLRRACRKDGYYIRGFSESAVRYYRKGELENAERVVRAGLLVEPSTLDLKQGLAHVLLAQAKKLLARDAVAAERRFSEVGAVGLPDDVLAEIRQQWDAAKSAPLPPLQAPAGANLDHHGFQRGE